MKQFERMNILRTFWGADDEAPDAFFASYSAIALLSDWLRRRQIFTPSGITDASSSWRLNVHWKKEKSTIKIMILNIS